MSKIMQEAKLSSLKDKISAVAPTDTADAVIVKIKKEDKILENKNQRSALGVISKKKK